MARRCLVFALVLLASRALQAQTPAGPQFQVNTHTAGDQSQSTVAVLADGGFVVVWADNGGADGSSAGVMARRFAADGAPLGADFRVNVYTTGLQVNPSVSADPRGGFVVGWFDIERRESWVRQFDASGQPRGGDVVVKDGGLVSPHLAHSAGGNFVVVWQDYVTGQGDAVFGRRFDAAAQPVGAEFRVNTASAYSDAEPSVASAPDGRFVVAWMGFDGYQSGVFARRFNAAGVPLGDQFQVNTYTGQYQRWFSGNHDHTVAMAPDGSFVVTWASGPDLPTFPDEIVAQRFDAAGSRAGAELRANTFPVGEFPEPRVAIDGTGDFVITWSSNHVGSQLVGRRFDASGHPRGAEFGVPSSPNGSPSFPLVDSDRAGNFVVTWHDYPGQDGSGSGVVARRFGGLVPAALAVDGAGNGVLEPGETVVMAPAWRNVTGLAQAFTGTLSGFTGPAGGSYAITDAAAAYGTVANGAVGSCGNACYGLSVSGTRPLLHWDAAVTEALAPESQGQRNAWTLHVGDSFTDVPRSSPFYGFVETLLHRGVTGGCGGSNFCPAGSTTREQMTVFALVAREGAGYVPPPCGTPVFNDVPASSPFCRWIEELARRGVASGCGGGNFCPGAAVTRDQMAVIVLRTLDPALNPPACTTPVFADVPASSPFCRWIEELARRGIVDGCGGGNYCPGAAVTREQMGVFLGLTFGLRLYGP